MHRKLELNHHNTPTHSLYKYCAIGDLYGDRGLLKKKLQHMEQLGVEPGETPVIFLGDIIGDRREGGLEILAHIHRMRMMLPEEKQDQMIQVLVGNHDLWVLMFFAGALQVHDEGLSSDEVDYYSKMYTSIFIESLREKPKEGGKQGETTLVLNRHLQGAGLNEFSQFLPFSIRLFSEFSEKTIKKMIATAPTLIENMRKSQLGKVVISEVASMKLFTRIDDTLFVHTSPTRGLMKELERYYFDPDIMNTIWKFHVSNIFSETREPIDSEKYFSDLCFGFLDTDNRFSNRRKHERYDVLTSEQANQLKAKGISSIVFGHTYTPVGRGKIVHGIRLRGVDYGRDNPCVYVQNRDRNIRDDYASRVGGLLDRKLDQSDICI